MKTKSVSESTFVNPRPPLIGRFSCLIGVLLALLLLVALPSSPAYAIPQCGDVSIAWYYYGSNGIAYELSVSPIECTIYVTTNLDTGYPGNPSWLYTNPGQGNPISPTFVLGGDIGIPYGHTLYIKAKAWQPGWAESRNVAYDEQHNPNL